MPSSYSRQFERRERLQKVQQVAKGIALAYVGLRVGVEALKFVGRVVRGKRREAAPASQGNRSTSGLAASGQPATAAAEDAWSEVDAAPPGLPDGYRTIVDAVLPCSPQELYGILFSTAGTELYTQQHRDVGRHWEVQATPWRRAEPAAAPQPVAAARGGQGAVPDGPPGADGSLLGQLSVFEYVAGQPGSGGFTRLLTFWNPKKPPNSNDTRCVQRQQFAAYRGGVVVFATAMNMLDIPFKECFTVNTFWRVAPGPSPGTCALSISLRVQFLKRALGVGAIINATTSREMTAFFSAFVANVDKHIGALRQQAGAPLPAPLPLPAPGTARGPSGVASGASRTTMQSPFAAVAGAPLPLPAGPSPGGGGAASMRQPLPLWKQVRALLVLSLLVGLLLHQLHLSSQIAALRAGAGGAEAAAAVADGAGGSGLAAQAAALLAAALEPVAAAAGGVHSGLLALLERVGGAARQRGLEAEPAETD
ncbi:hypothetical protein GPECTOR_9g617 [Gonium pectorale]|uniref:VASt domain-containing protein n=1 Tax=Gonium pectorale TaxID=33097 RepID=A0A150GRY3_GONPE|nr:hypothetical protein GPECTOR_9g617 [Gonium pectorale]|eukprot:KXZ52573.1 hypothetical protein GPECTOR_9g617 [Gonium pectorale]